MEKEKKLIERAGMVGWYDPVQLARTAVQVVISTILGRHTDKRFLQALADTGDLRKKLYYEVVAPDDQEEYWFDYIADVGDGFDSTYTAAYHITRPQLPLVTKGENKTVHQTQRGDLLVFGGDEVYPVASFAEYKIRLTDPYDAAFPEPTEAEKRKLGDQPRPCVFAIPGNHDWYDSLVAFSELFCSRRDFCGWTTKQNRSYFAIKLPHGWWLFGTDMQLGSSLDKAQVDYFKRVMEHVGKEDHIVLCNAEPHWITAKMYEGDPAFNNRNMGYFEGGVLRGQVAVYIAGDRHYYKRHELIRRGKNDVDPQSPNKIQKIVAGGGGAFLHPTHQEKVDEIGKRDIYELRKSFPTEPDSKAMTAKVLLFPLWNAKFIPLIGALYLFTAQAFYASIGPFVWPNIWASISDVFRTLALQPLAIFWVVIVALGFALFTDTHSKAYRLIAGPIHGISHLIVAFITGWITSVVVFGLLHLSSQSFWSLLLGGIVMFFLGGILGSFLMGFYLFVSLNIFGRHHNETFSAIKIPDFKNFLRLKIASNGGLTIYPVGIEAITTDWKQTQSGSHTLWEPTSTNDRSIPFLIEDPIRYGTSAADTLSTIETESTWPLSRPKIIDREL